MASSSDLAVVARKGQPVDITAKPAEDRAVWASSVSRPRTRSARSACFEAIPESFNTMGKVLTGHRPGLRARSRRLHQDLEQVSGRRHRRRVRAPSQSLERPRSIVGIVDVGSQIAGDVWGMLALLGLVSFSLGLINLLPVLPFDGGHAVVVLYEWIASKVQRTGSVRVDYRKLLPVTTVFMVLFLALRGLDDPARRAGRDRRLVIPGPCTGSPRASCEGRPGGALT